MKKGINFWSYGPGTTVKKALDIAKDAGFEGLELSMVADGVEGRERSSVRDIKKMAEDVGVAIPSVASGLYWDIPLTGSGSVGQQAKDNVRRQLDIAAEVGASAILVIPGVVGVDFIPGAEVCDYEVAYGRATEALLELKGYAEQAKVSIALENVWNKFLLSPLEMRAFIDGIGSEYVGAYLDVGNTVLTGYPDQWIRILGGRIKMVHFKDYRRDPGGFNAFVELLAGDVEFPAVRAALAQAGYDGYCVAEMIPGYTHYPNQIIYNTSASMDCILERKK